MTSFPSAHITWSRVLVNRKQTHLKSKEQAQEKKWICIRATSTATMCLIQNTQCFQTLCGWVAFHRKCLKHTVPRRRFDRISPLYLMVNRTFWHFMASFLCDPSYQTSKQDLNDLPFKRRKVITCLRQYRRWPYRPDHFNRFIGSLGYNGIKRSRDI